MKNVNKLVFLALASALALTSCGKKDAASISELNGDWKLSSGTSTDVIKHFNSLTGTLTYTSTTDLLYDGKAWTGTSSSDQSPAVPSTKVNYPQTIALSFDKKNGTYTQTTVTTSDETNQDVSGYYRVDPQSPANYISESFDIKTTSSSTEKEIGVYTVNEKSGDLKKGTEISLASTGNVTTSKNTYSFYITGSTSVFTGQVYTREYNYTNASSQYIYKIFPMSSQSVDSAVTTQYNSAKIYSVIESTKKSLKVNYNTSHSSVTKQGIVESNKQESTSTTELDFTK
jgi:hypothetical protein